MCAVQLVPAASRPVRPYVETRGGALVCRAPAAREVGRLGRHLEEKHRTSRWELRRQARDIEHAAVFEVAGTPMATAVFD